MVQLLLIILVVVNSMFVVAAYQEGETLKDILVSIKNNSILFWIYALAFIPGILVYGIIRFLLWKPLGD